MIVIPTLAQLYTSILSDLESQYGQTIPTFGKNFLRVNAAVQAAKLKLYYLAIGNLQKNIFVDTAEDEAVGGTLQRFGRVKLNRNPFAAVAGQYTLSVTGTLGSTIPALTTFKSNDDSANPGKLFVIDYSHTLPGTSSTINVRALEAGQDSQLSIGDQLTATAPIVGVNKTATVTVEIVEPLAAETLDAYRQKTLDAYRLEPNGGSASDYRLWASDAQGVERVYPFAKSGASNEINLYVEATIADSTDGKGTPSTAILNEVEEVVEADPDNSNIYERGRRPLGVFEIHFLPVTIKEISIEIYDFVDITSAIQTTIFDAIELLLSTKRPFVAGSDVLANKNDILDTNNIISTILTARPGSVFGTVILKVNGASVSSYTFTNGNIPHLNSVSYL